MIKEERSKEIWDLSIRKYLSIFEYFIILKSIFAQLFGLKNIAIHAKKKDAHFQCKPKIIILWIRISHFINSNMLHSLYEDLDGLSDGLSWLI